MSVSAPVAAPGTGAGDRALFLDVGETLVYAHPSPAEVMAAVCAEGGLEFSVGAVEEAEARVWPRVLARQAELPGDALYSLSAANSERFWTLGLRRHPGGPGRPGGGPPRPGAGASTTASRPWRRGASIRTPCRPWPRSSAGAGRRAAGGGGLQLGGLAGGPAGLSRSAPLLRLPDRLRHRALGEARPGHLPRRPGQGRGAPRGGAARGGQPARRRRGAPGPAGFRWCCSTAGGATPPTRRAGRPSSAAWTTSRRCWTGRNTNRHRVAPGYPGCPGQERSAKWPEPRTSRSGSSCIPCARSSSRTPAPPCGRSRTMGYRGWSSPARRWPPGRSCGRCWTRPASSAAAGTPPGRPCRTTACRRRWPSTRRWGIPS